MIHETKRGTRCAETKPVDEFRLRGGQFRERAYRQMWCKACEPEVRRERFTAAHGVSHTHACSWLRRWRRQLSASSAQSTTFAPATLRE
jgi:hypothetical protein